MYIVKDNLAFAPAAIVRQLLVDLGLGFNPVGGDQATLDWSCFYGQEPDRPDECITVFTTEGQDDGRSMMDGEIWHHYGIQIRLRARDERTGYAKLSGIRKTLSQGVYRRQVTVGPNVFQIQCGAKFSSVLPLGKDISTSKRQLFTLNLIAWIDQLN